MKPYVDASLLKHTREKSDPSHTVPDLHTSITATVPHDLAEVARTLGVGSTSEGIRLALEYASLLALRDDGTPVVLERLVHAGYTLSPKVLRRAKAKYPHLFPATPAWVLDAEPFG